MPLARSRDRGAGRASAQTVLPPSSR